MKDQTYYRIEVDGEIVQQDFDSYDKAMDGVHQYFTFNPESKEARIIKCTFKNLGVIVINKKQQ